MDKDACFINHGNIKRTPVLKKREIKELVVDSEVIIGGNFIGRCPWTCPGLCANTGKRNRVPGGVEGMRVRDGVTECRKIEPL